MNNNQITPLNLADNWLQTDQCFCNLQTGCNLESFKINHLAQFAVCRLQFAKTFCKLSKNPIAMRVSEQFSVCKKTPSLYERGEPPVGDAHHLDEEVSVASVKPVVLCLDLGTTSGWAIQSANGCITSGTISFKNSRFQGGGMRYLKFSRFLDELNQTAGPIHCVFFEEVRRHLGVDAAHAYGGFMAHLTAWCEQQSVAYEGVPVGTIKRHVTGKGNASKAMVIDAVKRLGHKPADDNEADALALMHWAIANRMAGGKL